MDFLLCKFVLKFLFFFLSTCFIFSIVFSIFPQVFFFFGQCILYILLTKKYNYSINQNLLEIGKDLEIVRKVAGADTI